MAASSVKRGELITSGVSFDKGDMLAERQAARLAHLAFRSKRLFVRFDTARILCWAWTVRKRVDL